MSWRSYALTLCAAGFALVSATALAENRVALVIGNSAYRSVPALDNPAKDAKAMAELLTAAGFDVTLATDLTQSDMRQAIQSFAAKIAEKGSDTAAQVFYAGHGVQVDGENFLVPVDAVIERESDVALQAVRLSDVMNTLSAVPSSIRIVILDACRNNPFSEIRRTTGRGLAIVDAPNGSIVSYSTAPGFEAEDGAGDHSPFTAALLATAKEPGLPIEQAFKRVRLSVNQATSGRQTPWESSSLTRDFSFFGGAASASTQVPAVKTAAAEPQTAAVQSRGKPAGYWRKELRARPAAEAYELVIKEDTAEAYQDFLAIYPDAPTSARVRSLLDRRREMMAWHDAVMLDSVASYQAFLAAYGYGDLAPTAGRLLERSRSRSLLANLVPAQACPVPPPPKEKKTEKKPEKKTEKKHAERSRTGERGPTDADIFGSSPPPSSGPPVSIGIGIGVGGGGMMGGSRSGSSGGSMRPPTTGTHY